MSIFTKAWNFIKLEFGKLDKETKLLVPIAINVVNAIKTVMESPVDNVLVAIIEAAVPNKAEAALVEKINATVKQWLPKVLTELTMINAIANITDPNEQLKAILAQLKLSSDQTKDVLYHGLSSLILQELSDGKLTWSDAVVVGEYYYTNFVKKAA